MEIDENYSGVTRHVVRNDFWITTRPNDNGLYLVPNHIDIPEEFRGSLVDNPHITWYSYK